MPEQPKGQKCTCILAPPKPGTPAALAGVPATLTVIDPQCPFHKDIPWRLKAQGDGTAEP